MAKSKLLSALDAHKGRDYKKESQKKLQKSAAKKKALRVPSEDELNDVQMQEDGIVMEMSEGSDDEVDDIGGFEDEDEDEEEEDDDNDDDDNGIPLSDLDSLSDNENGDIIPYQRLTINNTKALTKAHESISLDYKSLPFSAHQTIITSEPVLIADVHDDLTRELAFYKQCLDAANSGRQSLLKENVPFTRPTDYFAEMVKSDEQMGKVKRKLVDDAADKKAAGEARKQRDLKKFGKQVQIAKEQERAKAKREGLNKIDLIKKKRKDGASALTATTDEDMFDVSLDNNTNGKDVKGKSTGRDDKRGGGIRKRQKKDEKFGFGGRKRFSKSSDAVSTGDMSGFSVKGMKRKPGGKTPRPGKSKRAKK